MQDTEELILDLNESSQICAQSLLVRSKPTRSRTWSQKWKRDSWTRLLYGRILKPSLGKAFEERWTSSLEASLVTLSQPRAVEEEMKILDTSSHISKEESLFSDLPLFSLRTSKESSHPNSEKDGTTEQERPFSSMSFVSWKDWVTKRRREYLARAKSAHLIKERESSSWASPRTGMSKAPAGGGDPNKKEYHSRIENQVQKWATPIKEDYKRRGPNSKQQGLPNQIQNWPTVRANKGQGGPQDPSKLRNKDGTIWTGFGTPYKNGMNKQVHLTQLMSSPIYGLQGEEKNKKNGSQKEQLNPRWVPTLMGVPIGWTMATCVNPYVVESTNSDSLVTELSPQPQKEPLESFGKNWATPTADQLTFNESLNAYFRRSVKRIMKGKKPFPTQLTFEVEAEEKGINIQDNLELNDFVVYALEFGEPFMRLDGLDSSVVGLDANNKLVYSYSKMIDFFSKEMSYDDAIEWINFNIISIESDKTFRILYDLK